MTITVNGKVYTCQEGTTLTQFLEIHKFPTQQTAIAVNGEVIPASQRDSFKLKDQSTLIIIKAAQGG